MTSTQQDSDLIIIGAGPGGYETALTAARHGLRVTLVERDLVGGTCLNRGCIPTKALIAALHGAGPDGGVEGAVATLRSGVEALLASCENLTLVRGEARLVDAHTVDVDGTHLSAPRVIIATGSRPRLLPIPGADRCDTSDDLLAEMPEAAAEGSSMVIIGGGVIGIEFAVIFRRRGWDVTVVEYCKEILPPFDRELAKRLRTSLSRTGIKCVTGAQVTAVEAAPGGSVVSLEAKSKQQTLEADRVLMAVGRAPVLPDGLADAGIDVERGAIVTDGQWRTSADGVWAIGDVNARCMLAHAATAQGHNVLCQFIPGLLPKNTDVIPSVVFAEPELAMVGLTEQQATEQGLDLDIRRTPYRANGKAVASGETDGLVKMMVDRATGRIAGCHILGAHAADLIHEAAVVMANGLPATAIAATVHAHPTLSELL